LVDLNVLIDVLQNRQPFYEDSARLLDAVVTRQASGWIAAHSVTTLFYVVSRFRNHEFAVGVITELLGSFTVATVDDAVIRRAVTMGWRDLEDAVQMAAAEAEGVDYLVTRNVRDFESGRVPVIQPAALLALMEHPGNE
jgi:predicted nucleic acid-binding protein